jgi:hypothetical protein
VRNVEDPPASNEAADWNPFAGTFDGGRMSKFLAEVRRR